MLHGTHKVRFVVPSFPTTIISHCIGVLTVRLTFQHPRTGKRADTMEAKKSCVFCRTRKMKCSGATPKCESCSVRELNCVYEHAARKPATASNVSSSALGSSTPSSSNITSSTAPSVKAKTRSRKNNTSTLDRTFGEALDEAFASLGSEPHVDQGAVAVRSFPGLV